jgi:hypothetical protein
MRVSRRNQIKQGVIDTLFPFLGTRDKTRAIASFVTWLALFLALAGKLTSDQIEEIIKYVVSE